MEPTHAMLDMLHICRTCGVRISSGGKDCLVFRELRDAIKILYGIDVSVMFSNGKQCQCLFRLFIAASVL